MPGSSCRSSSTTTCRALARRRPVAPRRRHRRRRAGATASWPPPLYARRPLDARQLGVPLVRGLGPRVPLRRRWRASIRASRSSSSLLLCREWYMHPNGQLPAYEFAFGDVNPPVHAWAAWRVYQLDRRQRGSAGPRCSSSASSRSCMLNFTWWVNRKDARREQPLLRRLPGLDNVGFFDRSKPLPGGRRPRAGRRHRAGWRSTAAPCSPSRSSSRGRTRAYAGHRLQVLRALRRHRRTP